MKAEEDEEGALILKTAVNQKRPGNASNRKQD